MRPKDLIVNKHPRLILTLIIWGLWFEKYCFIILKYVYMLNQRLMNCGHKRMPTTFQSVQSSQWIGIISYDWTGDSRAAVPNLVGTRDQYRGRQFFYSLEWGVVSEWVKHIIFKLTSWSLTGSEWYWFIAWRLGTPILGHYLLFIPLYSQKESNKLDTNYLGNDNIEKVLNSSLQNVFPIRFQSPKMDD